MRVDQTTTNGSSSTLLIKMSIDEVYIAGEYEAEQKFFR
jgi:hypothetical protein